MPCHQSSEIPSYRWQWNDLARYLRQFSSDKHWEQNQLCVWSSFKDQRCVYLVLKEKIVGCPIEYLTIQAFELEQNRLLFIYQKSGIYQRLLNKKKSFWHSSKLSDIPKPSSKYKTILMAFFLQYLTISRKHLVNK